jgi:hypothetical protein
MVAVNWYDLFCPDGRFYASRHSKNLEFDKYGRLCYAIGG